MAAELKAPEVPERYKSLKLEAVPVPPDNPVASLISILMVAATVPLSSTCQIRAVRIVLATEPKSAVEASLVLLFPNTAKLPAVSALLTVMVNPLEASDSLVPETDQIPSTSVL